ncbi:MAG: uracil-xanthine permease [Lachnospiraceae bacterium]|nr:uracil-xanthine permease [Lachnospiraceae bacterium]
MKLTYQVTDKPKFGQVLIFALQQLLAILAATIAVPAIINSNMGTSMSASAALFGAGVGTLVYLLFTRFKSPVFLGSSFAFLGSMMAAFAGGVSMSLGYFGLILGAAFAGLVYVVLSLIVKIAGVNWINKLMPAVIIGPTVAIIGLSLAGNAVGDLFVGKVGYVDEENNFISTASPYLCIICGLVTLFVTMACSVYGKKMMKMIPFIIGICAGYVLAAVLTIVGGASDITELKIIDFSAFSNMQWYPDFTFIKAFFGEAFEYGEAGSMAGYILTILVAYVPVAFVVFAEHIADHKNLSSIIEKDLLKDPGLHNTLLGDGVGSMVGAFFGGCPNTTYGESVGCVAISGNASIITILTTAVLAIVASFFAPFVTFLATIPNCVMGGVCVALYGFIAVSGLKMIQGVDLEDNRNLFVVSVILIAGIGGLILKFGSVEITEVACALILGIITNIVLKGKSKKDGE